MIYLVGIYKCLECVECSAPELVEPRPELTQALGIDAVDASRTIGNVRDQPGLLQNLQMLGHRGSTDGHLVGDALNRERPVAQMFEYCATCAVGQGDQCITVSHGLR